MKNLNNVMADNGVPKVNFKGFMAKNVQADWNAMKKIYGGSGLHILMVNRERTCSFSLVCKFG